MAFWEISHALFAICSFTFSLTNDLFFSSNSVDSRRHPELNKWFKDFLGYKESGSNVDPVPHSATGKERISGDLAMEIGKYFVFMNL